MSFLAPAPLGPEAPWVCSAALLRYAIVMHCAIAMRCCDALRHCDMLRYGGARGWLAGAEHRRPNAEN